MPTKNRKKAGLGRVFDEVRAKGVLIKEGNTYHRQKPITKMLKGKEITISFAFNRIIKGFYGIIEAHNLQPSHSTGVQNPLHFLPEAQPRNRSSSKSGRETPQLIARNLRPSEIIEGANAYTGAPIANLRGEALQKAFGAALSRVDSFENLKKKYNHLVLSISENTSKKQIDLSKIVVPKEKRNSGIGSQFMTDLVSYADKKGYTIILNASSDFGGNTSRLIKFYKRFGFVENKGRNKDYELSTNMYRYSKNDLSGCECDNHTPTSNKEAVLTVKLPVSINTLKKHGNSIFWDKQKIRNLSDSEFITLWKYTIAANTMLSDSIFPKTQNGDRHILSQYGKKELVNNANEELVRRGLDKKYTLFTERKEKKSLPKKIVSKQPHKMTFEEFSKKTLLTKARDGFSDMTFYFYFVGWKNDEMFVSDSEDLKAIKDTRKDYKEFNNLRDALARNSIYSVFPNRPKKVEEVKREAYKIYLQSTYPSIEPTSNQENEELEIAIAKMKMLKLKAKALQMKELEGLLYGLEHIYDDSELDGIGLDGLDGKDVYEIVNEKVLETIERGNLSWRQTWKIKSRGGAAANYDSKRAYSGANFFLLNFILPLMGDDYEYPYFLTFKQIQAKKGKIKKGSKGYPIFYYNVVRKYQGKKITDDEYKKLKAKGIKNIEQIRFLKYYTIFNIAAVEDVEFDLSELEKGEKVNYEYEAIEAAEKIYHYMPNKPNLKVDSQAYYFPSEDYVGMPPVVTFENPQAFYSVLYHELIHSTKHPIRLDDKTRGGKKFGDKDYALEELVAELGACYLCAESGILFHTINNSAAYLKGCNEKLVASIKEDKTFFLKAAARAQRASDYILDYDKNGVPAYQRNEYYEPIPLHPSIVKTPTKVVKSTENEDIEIAIAKMKMLKLKAKALQL